jgi:CRP-like cAMP-binding protein
MKPIRFRPQEIIFKQGSDSDRLYLIKQGTVGLTAQIDLTTYRRIPTGSQNWEMIINIKTLDYKVKELKAGELVGIEEFLLQDVQRCVEAQALTECELQFIDIKDFLESK